jgi:hypothetical protein
MAAKRESERKAGLSEASPHITATASSPDDAQGIVKIIRAVFALRNRNGGYLVIGFNNDTLQPQDNDRPSDVRATFHVDKVQGIISRYASELFEIGIAFPLRDGREYPVICVPVGVQAPVAPRSCPSQCIRICCAIRRDTSSPTMATIRVRWRTISGIAICNQRHATPRWRRIGFRSSGRTKSETRWQGFRTNEEARAALATPASLSALNETG